MTTRRVVLDTNVLISGFLSTTSVPGRVLDQVVTSAHLLGTEETLEELVTRLMAPKFDRNLTRQHRRAALDRLIPLIEIVASVRVIRACRDPDDDKFLEAAVNGRADVLISGDKDLLALHPFLGIAILTPAEFLARDEKSDE